mgnify:FL=1
MKSEEASFKRYDAESRLKIDRDEQQARRTAEGDAMKGEGGKTARAEIEDSVATQLQQLAAQFAQSMQELSSNQIEIVSVLQEIKGSQDDVTDAVTKVVGHMTAPRKVKRDDRGRAVGFEVGESEGDMRSMLEKLTSGQRQIMRDKQGRAEAFA